MPNFSFLSLFTFTNYALIIYIFCTEFLSNLSGIDIYTRGSPSFALFNKSSKQKNITSSAIHSEAWFAEYSEPYKSGTTTNVGIKLEKVYFRTSNASQVSSRLQPLNLFFL